MSFTVGSRESGISEEDLATPSTFDDNLDPDLEAIDSNRPKEGGFWKRPSIYVAAFERMRISVPQNCR
jgi:hypothetical protein